MSSTVSCISHQEIKFQHCYESDGDETFSLVNEMLEIKKKGPWINVSIGLSFVLHTLKEETFASGKIREIFGINFRELAVFAFLARINFREFMI